MKYADTRYNQYAEEERSVAKPEDVAAYKAEQAKKAATAPVGTRISKPTLSLINKVVGNKDMPKIEKPEDPTKKYPGSCNE